MQSSATPTLSTAESAAFSPGHFASRDGTRLYCEWLAASHGRPRGLALILHGYAEHCGRYHEVANTLADAGLSVLTFDFRGHGRSDGARGHVDSYSQYVEDAEAALAELHSRANGDTLPVLLVCHSNGGLVGLRWLSDPTRPAHRIRAAVLSSPFLGLYQRVPAAKRLLVDVAGRLRPTLAVPNDLNADLLTRDADKRAARRADNLCHEVATLGWFRAASEAQQQVLACAIRIEVPTLWLVSGADRIVDASVSRVVHARLRSDAEYHEFPDMYHELFNETDRARVLGLVSAFGRKHLSI
jgi:lysophospholipase